MKKYRLTNRKKDAKLDALRKRKLSTMEKLVQVYFENLLNVS